MGSERRKGRTERGREEVKGEGREKGREGEGGGRKEGKREGGGRKERRRKEEGGKEREEKEREGREEMRGNGNEMQQHCQQYSWCLVCTYACILRTLGLLLLLSAGSSPSTVPWYTSSDID